MRVGRQLSLLTWLLVGVQVATSLAGIAMLDRMSPAIGRILRENVDSVRALEEMLTVLAAPGPADRAAFEAALVSAEGNVTEPEEPALLETIRGRSAAALAGEPAARRAAVEALAELGRVNRAAMVRADGEALRIGSAGRWTLAFLALIGLAASLLSIRRANERLLAPLAELHAAVSAFRQGDLHRRCRALGPSELSDLLEGVDELLDRAERAAPAAPREATHDRAALLALLDRLGRPALILDASGALVAASASALDRLEGEGDAILARLRAGEPAEGETLEPLGELALAQLA